MTPIEEFFNKTYGKAIYSIPFRKQNPNNISYFIPKSINTTLTFLADFYINENDKSPINQICFMNNGLGIDWAFHVFSQSTTAPISAPTLSQTNRMDQFLQQVIGQRILWYNWSGSSGDPAYIIPLYKINDLEFSADDYDHNGRYLGKNTYTIGNGFGVGHQQWSLYTTLPFPSSIAPTMPSTGYSSPVNNFLKRFKNQKIKRINWNKNYIVPIVVANDNEVVGEMYEIKTNRYIKRSSFEISNSPGLWVMLAGTINQESVGPLFYKKPIEEEKKTHKCHCDLRELLNYGCKCGGI